MLLCKTLVSVSLWNAMSLSGSRIREITTAHHWATALTAATREPHISSSSKAQWSPPSHQHQQPTTFKTNYTYKNCKKISLKKFWALAGKHIFKAWNTVWCSDTVSNRFAFFFLKSLFLLCFTRGLNEHEHGKKQKVRSVATEFRCASISLIYQ